MLIPSIDLMNGRVVQLEQGERVRLEFDNLDEWIDRFAAYPIVQVIDLDAAINRGSNEELVRRVSAARPCQVGGGIKSVDRARALLDAGARRVILGSVLFTGNDADREVAEEFSDGLGREHLIAALDSRSGHVVISGWKKTLSLTPEEAARQLEPFVDAFLYTHVDTEGLLSGINMDAVRSVARSTTRRLIAAGGISSREEVDALDALGIDAVVGMALYSGQLR